MGIDIKKTIKEMTLEEKVGMVSGLDFWHLKGIDRLGIPSIMVTDGPHGLRKQATSADHLGLNESVPATCFPSAVGLASSWDRNLIQEVGIALGKEAQAENVGVLLGPGVNLKRSPLNGRNFEYFSEDPYITSEMASSYIEGVQSQGIGTSLKHFAVNNQEHRRMTTNVSVDERTLREIYLASFEEIVKKSQPWSVMSSYNQVNGEFASENKRLLTDILKTEWGFEGFVVSDWGAVNEHVESLEAGLDLEMPSSNGLGERKILKAIEEGQLSEDILDDAVMRVLSIIDKVVENNVKNSSFDKKAHHKLARKVAGESMVLLKNEGNILPLESNLDVAIIGEFAKIPRYQGGGSSHINPTKLDQPYEEIRNIAGKSSDIKYAQGFEIDSEKVDQALINEAKKIAERAEVAVLFIGLPDHYESEGYDREHLRIPENQKLLIEEIAKVQQNIIVVLSNGSPIEMPWINKVKGIIEGYLGGQASGGAVADVLYGKVNPSGKLAETFPMRLSDNPSYLNFPGEGDRVDYKEGIFIGYRYYDMKEIEPLFPFGYGLSYTDFEYSNLVIDQQNIKDTDSVNVSVTIKNIGQRRGKEVIQLYIKDVESTVIRPKQELRDFAKVDLQPTEETTITFSLDKKAFAYYHVDIKDWYVESGQFEILIGKSSRDIKLKGMVTVESTSIVASKIHKNTTFGDLLAHPGFTEDDSNLIAEAIGQIPFSAEEEGSTKMEEAFLAYMPLRTLVSFSQGKFTEEMLLDLIKKINKNKI
jgi:beta-glucosidase